MNKLLTFTMLCATLVISELTFCQRAFAQHSLSIRGTPIMMGSAKIENPSPLSVLRGYALSFDAGIEYNYTSRNGWGIGAGTDMGLICSGYRLRGEGIKTSDYFVQPQYFYNALSVNASYKKSFGKYSLHGTLGPSIRYYHHGDEGIYLRMSNSKNGFYTPFPGATDYFKVDGAPPNEHLNTEVITGLNLERSISESCAIFLGIRKDWGLRPISDGEMSIRLDNEVYEGKFSPRSNYLGANVAFKYIFPGKKDIERSVGTIRSFTNSRRSIYGEFLGNGPAISLNYDQRFNGDRNGGLGYRVGVGYILEGFSVPLAVNHLLGDGRNALETGIGVTPLIRLNPSEYRKRVDAIAFLNLGYRFQPLRDGLLFRLTYTPGADRYGFVAGWVGGSVGYTFR